MGVNEEVEPTTVVVPSLKDDDDDMLEDDDMPRSMVLTPRDAEEHNGLDLHTNLVRGRDPLMRLCFACDCFSPSEDPLASSADNLLRRQPDRMFHAEPKAEMNAVEELGHQLDGLAMDGSNNACDAGLGMELDEEMVDEKTDGSDDAAAVQLDFDESEPPHHFVYDLDSEILPGPIYWTHRARSL